MDETVTNKTYNQMECCDSLLLLFGTDRATANISVVQHLCVLISRSTPKTVLLHAEPCNQHGAQLVKHSSRLGSRIGVGLCSFTRLVRGMNEA
mmetsp:Transcript_52098/g.138847  ORF Transcript_52098/g.138847 Transcript_52098/m.138847 type:complete len:93 (-) Transcript_52098:237-515(-)